MSIFSFTDHLGYNLIPLLESIEMILRAYTYIMLSSCLLGRRVTLNRKLIIYSFGIVILKIAFYNLIEAYLFTFYNTLYKKVIYHIATRNERLLIDTQITNLSICAYIIILVYLFFFFLGVFKDKKIIHSLEAILLLFLYERYFTNIVKYTAVYFNGGDYKFAEDLFAYTTFASDKIATLQTLVPILLTLIFSLLLLLGFFRKKTHYVIGIKDRILFFAWAYLFFRIQHLPFDLGGTDFRLRYKYLCYIFGSIVPFLGWIVPAIVLMRTCVFRLNGTANPR